MGDLVDELVEMWAEYWSNFFTQKKLDERKQNSKDRKRVSEEAPTIKRSKPSQH